MLVVSIGHFPAFYDIDVDGLSHCDVLFENKEVFKQHV